MELKNSEFTVGIYRENNIAYLHISSENGTGCKYKINSLDDVMTEMKKYIESYCCIKSSFTDDVDKMADFLELLKEEFLQSYSYLTEFEYDETRNQFNNSKAEILADLMRAAENLLLEESNGRPTGCEITGEQLKVIVANYALNNLTTSEYKDFEDICESTGC